MNLPNRASDAGPENYETFRASDALLQCGSCRAYVAALSPCTWDADLLVGACCAVDEEPEPDCTCVRIDVDYYDAGGCELCDVMSGYNVRQRSVQPRPAVRADVGRASEAISKKEVA